MVKPHCTKPKTFKELINQLKTHPINEEKKTTKARQTYYLKNLKFIFLMNIDAKFLNKTLANQTQQHNRRTVHHDQVGLISRCKGHLE